MKNLPIDLVLELRQAFAPIVREQQRGQLAAHALQGVFLREEGHISLEDEEDLAGQAVRVADHVLRALYPDGLA